MSAAVALTAPRHTRGGAGGAVLPRRQARRATQMVDIPERIYRGSHYSDVFIKAWGKIAALDLDGNIEHCNAGVEQLARFTGLSVRDVQRALTEGRTPGPDGGPPEFTTRRMTRTGGTGRTAIRAVRDVTTAERSVRVPVTMCDALTPRQLRAALLALHAEQDGHVFTAAELGGELFHHHGDHKGETLTERTARRILNSLEDTGWIGVDHRAGHQGRNTVTVHRHPLQPTPLTDTPAEPAAPADTGQTARPHITPATGSAPVGDWPTAPDAAEQACADIHGGSGTDTSGGSLAIKEYRRVVTDGITQLGGGIRRRRTSGTGPRAVDNPAPDTFRSGRALRADEPGTGRRPGRDWHRLTKQQQEQIRTVLAPVWHELAAFTAWERQRTIADVLQQLAEGVTVDRLQDRVERRYARTTEIRSIPRWLIGAALVRRGCGDPRCETGVIWESGADCELCAVNRQTAAARAQREQDLAAAEQRAGLERARRLAELDATGAALPTPAAAGADLEPTRPLPPKRTYRERSAAPEGEIRAAIRTLGPAYALHMYGALRALPLINEQRDLPKPAAPQPVMLAPVRQLADRVRSALGAPPSADLSVACPKPGCNAQPGQACTTPRGRRRTDVHHARLDAATASRPAADGEEETRPHAQ